MIKTNKTMKQIYKKKITLNNSKTDKKKIHINI